MNCQVVTPSRPPSGKNILSRESPLVGFLMSSQCAFKTLFSPFHYLYSFHIVFHIVRYFQLFSPFKLKLRYNKSFNVALKMNKNPTIIIFRAYRNASIRMLIELVMLFNQIKGEGCRYIRQ